VKVELREEILTRFEKAIMHAGAENYDQGMQQFGKILEYLHKNFDPIRSKESFRAVFDDMPDPSRLELRLILGVLNFLPQIARYALKHLVTIAEDDLPAIPTGRKGLELQEKVRIVDFVGNQLKHVRSLDRCIKTAAERFHTSESTVQRAWDDRTSIDPADFRSALRYLADGPY